MAYSTHNGSFTFEEFNSKGRNFDMCLAKFRKYKNLNMPDTVLYRLERKNYIAFWNYGVYLFDKRYDLPYTDWEAVNNRRGVIENKSGFQDF